MGGGEEHRRSGGLSRKPVDGAQLDDLGAHGADNLPTARGGTDGHGQGTADLYPERNDDLQLGVQGQVELVGDHGKTDDPHGLLGIVLAVGEGHGGRTDQLGLPEDSVHPVAGEVTDHPEDDQDQDHAHDEAHRRGDDDEGTDLLQLVHVQGLESGMSHDRPGQSAQKRVAGAGRDPEPPGEEVPGDGGQEGGSDDGRNHVLAVGDALGDGGGHGGPGQGSGEVQGGRHGQGVLGRQDPGTHHSCDGVGGVVEAVDVVDAPGEEDQHCQGGNQEDFDHRGLRRFSSR